MNQIVLKPEIFNGSATVQALTLMDGEIPASEAGEALRKLVSSVKGYYRMRNLRGFEHGGKTDDWAEAMLAGVSADSEELAALLRQSQQEGKSVRVVARVEVVVDSQA